MKIVCGKQEIDEVKNAQQQRQNQEFFQKFEMVWVSFLFSDTTNQG